jgi:hypothetical protein
MHDVSPIGLCIVTQDLLDIRRYKGDFGDFTLLRMKDKNIETQIFDLKRQLNSRLSEAKFLEGHKAVIVSNIDKIISLVSSRYSQINLRQSEKIIEAAKDVMSMVMMASNFDQIAELEPGFRSKVTLPVYDLFVDYLKTQSLRLV